MSVGLLGWQEEIDRRMEEEQQTRSLLIDEERRNEEAFVDVYNELMDSPLTKTSTLITA